MEVLTKYQNDYNVATELQDLLLEQSNPYPWPKMYLNTQFPKSQKLSATTY